MRRPILLRFALLASLWCAASVRTGDAVPSDAPVDPVIEEPIRPLLSVEPAVQPDPPPVCGTGVAVVLPAGLGLLSFTSPARTRRRFHE